MESFTPVYHRHDLTILKEPIKLVARVRRGIRSGVLALTPTRLVYLRKSFKKTLVDSEHYLGTVTNVGYQKSLGSWQLTFLVDGRLTIYKQKQDDLQVFVEPIRASIAERISSQGEYGGYDLSGLAEPVKLMAMIIFPRLIGSNDRLLIMTRTRLVSLVKVDGITRIDKKYPRNSISQLTYKKSFGLWTLAFIYLGKKVVFNQINDNLEPFFQSLQQDSLENNTAEKKPGVEHKQRTVTNPFLEPDLTILDEPVQSVIRARSGVLALTSTRLTYLRIHDNNTYLKSQYDRNLIYNVKFEQTTNGQDFSFEYAGEPIFYSDFYDEIEPLVEQLRRSAIRNAAVTNNPGQELGGYDLTFLNEPVHLAKRVPGGVTAITESKFVYISGFGSDVRVNFEVALEELVAVSFEAQGADWSIQLEGTNGISEFTAPPGDLAPFVSPLRDIATENTALRERPGPNLAGYDLTILSSPTILAKLVPAGVIALTEETFVLIEGSASNPTVDFKVALNRLTEVAFDEQGSVWRIRLVNSSGYNDLTGNHTDLAPFVEPLIQRADRNQHLAIPDPEATNSPMLSPSRDSQAQPKQTPRTRQNNPTERTEWGCKRWGCITAIVIIALLLLMIVCSTNSGYNCAVEGNRLFTWDASGVQDVLEYNQRCP